MSPSRSDRRADHSSLRGDCGPASPLSCASPLDRPRAGNMGRSFFGLRWRDFLRPHVSALWVGVWFAPVLFFTSMLLRALQLPGVVALV